MPNPSIDRIREALPWGAWRRPDGTFFRAVHLDLTEGPKFNKKNKARAIEGGGWERQPDHYLTPDQIKAAIDERCGTCGGTKRCDSFMDGVGEYPCDTCNGTGSAHPELVELVVMPDSPNTDPHASEAD